MVCINELHNLKRMPIVLIGQYARHRARHHARHRAAYHDYRFFITIPEIYHILRTVLIEIKNTGKL